MSKLTNRRNVRIEWGDCDPAGIIYYPRYFEFIDASTWHLFERALGMKPHDFFTFYESAGFPVVATRGRFIRPTRYGDDVVIESTIAFGRSSFSVDHKMSLDGAPVSEFAETRVWVIRDPQDPERLKSSPIPQALIDKFREP